MVKNHPPMQEIQETQASVPGSGASGLGRRARALLGPVLCAGQGTGSLTSRLSSRKAGEVQLKRSGSSQPRSSSHSRTAAPEGG